MQHAYEITTVSINEKSKDLKISLFPNPTSNNVNINIEQFNSQTTKYNLIDLNGKLILKGDLSNKNTTIDMEILPPATYFINVFDRKNNINQLFKVIKH